MHVRTVIIGCLIVILPAILLALASCAPGSAPRLGGSLAVEVHVGADDNGDRVTLQQGQILVPTLGANSSTGYSWEVEEVNSSVLRQIGESEFQAVSDEEPAPPGSSGLQSLRFEAVGAGETQLKLIYHQPWMKDVEPEKTYAIQVVVR